MGEIIFLPRFLEPEQDSGSLVRLRRASGLAPSAFARAIAKELGWPFPVESYLEWERGPEGATPPRAVMRAAARIVVRGPGEFDTQRRGVGRRDFLKLTAGVGMAFAGAPGESVRQVPLALLDALELERLRVAVRRLIGFERAAQYAALRAVLPTVFAETLRFVDAAPDDVKPTACGLLSRVHAVSAWLLIKEGHPLEAQAVAANALEAASQAEDPILVASALRCIGETHLRAGHYQLALDLSVEASEFVSRIHTAGEAVLCVAGAGYLSAAIAAARAGDRIMAQELLVVADDCAVRLGRDLAGPAVFGPSNVSIHRVAVAVDLGDSRTALRQAERTVLTPLGGFEERHGRYWIDVARSHVAEKQDFDAVAALLRAEMVAPEEVHQHPLSRAALTELLGRERKGAVPALRPLARRCGVA